MPRRQIPRNQASLRSLTPGVDVSCPQGQPIEPEILVRLEELDDTIFAALRGDAQALDQSACLWENARGEIRDHLLEEARAQYVRYAQSIWSNHRGSPEETLHQAFAALEILSLLDVDGELQPPPAD